MTVEVIDSGGRLRRADGANASISRHPAPLRERLPMRFDAMSAVGGPYAQGDPRRRARGAGRHRGQREPLEDFGGLHPDPNRSMPKT
jgi:phosphoglucomutase